MKNDDKALKSLKGHVIQALTDRIDVLELQILERNEVIAAKDREIAELETWRHCNDFKIAQYDKLAAQFVLNPDAEDRW